MEHHLMIGIMQKSRKHAHRGQTAALAFRTQVLFDARYLRSLVSQGFGLVRVQLVIDNMPTAGFRTGRDHRLQMRQKIGLRACRSTARSHDLARHDITPDDQGASPMLPALKFAPLDLSRS